MSGFAFAAPEVAEWLSMQVEDFSRFAEKLTITGRMAKWFQSFSTPEGGSCGVGVEIALATVVVEELAALEASIGPSKALAASSAASVTPSLRDLKFGLETRKNLRHSFEIACPWLSAGATFEFLNRVECKGTVESACQDCRLTIKPDRLEIHHSLLRWTV